MTWLVSLLKGSSLALLAAFLLSFGGRFHFMLDNLSSFRMHFVIGFFVLVAAFLLARERVWAGIAVAGLIASMIPVAPWYLPIKEAIADGGAEITVLSANVFAFNDSADRLVAMVDSEKPDVFGVVELSPQFARGLEPLHKRYQHRFERPAEGFDGVGLYSRLPLLDVRVLTLGEDLPTSVSAIVEWEGRQIEFIVAHPDAPMTSSRAKRRNRQLQLLADHVEKSGRDSILLGDLNVAMWSPYYHDFVETAGLKNARMGRGVAGSWPPVTGLSVPIDHILATSDIELREFRVLPSIGSDHLPIAARVIVLNGS